MDFRVTGIDVTNSQTIRIRMWGNLANVSSDYGLREWPDLLNDACLETCPCQNLRQGIEAKIEVDPFAEPVFTDDHLGLRRTVSKMRLRFRKRV